MPNSFNLFIKSATKTIFFLLICVSTNKLHAQCSSAVPNTRAGRCNLTIPAANLTCPTSDLTNGLNVGSNTRFFTGTGVFAGSPAFTIANDGMVVICGNLTVTSFPSITASTPNTGSRIYIASGGSLTINNSGTWSSSFSTIINYGSLTLTTSGSAWNADNSCILNNGNMNVQSMDFSIKTYAEMYGTFRSYGNYSPVINCAIFVGNGAKFETNNIQFATDGPVFELLGGPGAKACYNLTGNWIQRNWPNTAVLSTNTGFQLCVSNASQAILNTTPPLVITSPGFVGNAQVNTGCANCSALPLPVSFGDISVKEVEGMAEITWTTYTETKNEIFIVERSEDLQNSIVIGTVKGQGNSHRLQKYKHKDTSPLPSCYYRIKQQDYDGSNSYTEWVTYKSTTGKEISIIFDNTSKSITINFSEKGNYEIKVFDMLGKLVMDEISDDQSGIAKLDLKIQKEGIYIVRVSSRNGLISKNSKLYTY